MFSENFFYFRYNLECEVIDSQKSAAFKYLTDKQPVVRAIIIGNATAETQKTSKCIVYEQLKKANTYEMVSLR